ncbi:MAG: radical SAM protein, partial [Eubacteriales bacterium]
GLQMMTGLYGDTDDGALRTADELIALAPATVRIYPTVVLEGTELARLWRAGEYTPQTLDDAVPLCAELLSKFDDAGIAVIRLGLHSGGGVEDGCLAGAYHPAFRELCESRIYLARALAALGASPADTKTATLLVAPSEISKMVGQKRENLKELKRLGYDCQVKADENLHKYEVAVLKD